MNDGRIGNPSDGTPVDQITWIPPLSYDDLHAILVENRAEICKFLDKYTNKNYADVSIFIDTYAFETIIKLFGEAWFNAPDNWYILHSYAIWDMICDLPVQWYDLKQSLKEGE